MREFGTQRDGQDKSSRRHILATTGAVSAGLLAGCLGGGSDDDTGGYSSSSPEPGTETGGWQSVELEPVRDGEPFTIKGLEAPVVVQSFAVWCPKCERQSEQLAKLDDSITKVGLNTDPNEDAAKVRSHAMDNGFDWRFAVAPTAMTESLVEEFGTTVTNAPSTPVIIVCEDGTTKFNAGSVDSASEIQSAADEC